MHPRSGSLWVLAEKGHSDDFSSECRGCGQGPSTQGGVGRQPNLENLLGNRSFSALERKARWRLPEDWKGRGLRSFEGA